MLSYKTKDVYQRLNSTISDTVPGARLICATDGKTCFPEEGAIRLIADRCRSLNVEALVVETGPKTLIVAGYEFEDVYAALECPADMNPALAIGEILRGIAGMSVVSQKDGVLPAGFVNELLMGWERKISRVFGRRFASQLIDRACDGMHPADMTEKDIETVRRRISSAICGCIEFAES